MKHYGDITKLSGYELPVVDVITGGSPCQDLSVAGKRAGLAGERSGLFMEQIRIVKEMRERDRATGRTGRYVRPRYMVWENVPGAFSSNGGKDFQAVLEEIVKIVEAEVPDLSGAVQGGWTKSGCLYSDMGKWSVAWRVHDAQFWGVPQRRKRIALVADFGGLSAPEILFERKGLSGDSEPSGTAGKGTAAGTEGGVDSAVRDGWVESEGTYYDPGGNIFDRPDDDAICLQGNGIDRADTAGCNGRGWRRGGVTPLTRSTDPQSCLSKNEPENQGGAKESSFSMNTPEPCRPSTTSQCLTAGFKGGQSKDGGIGYEVEQSPTLSATPSALEPTVITAAFKAGNGAKAGNIGYEEELSPTLSAAESGTNQVPTCFAVDCRNATENSDVNGTLQAKSGGVQV